LEGTTVVAEELIGGRTATVRAITAERNSAARGALVARVQSASQPRLPGVYTTTAMAGGAFLFRDLPPGEYCLTAREGDTVGVLSGLQVGGARTASATVMQLAQAGAINGKVRYEQGEATTPDNSGILAFVKGTSFLGYSQGSTGDYSIPGVPNQSASDKPHTIVAMAGGFADGSVLLPQPLAAASVIAPLIFLTHEALLLGRVYDPAISDPDDQGLSSATIVAGTGQSATSDAEGFFEIRGLKPGGNFVTVTRSTYRDLRTQVGPLLTGTTFFLPVAMRK
jgi:hypothetical protein